MLIFGRYHTAYQPIDIDKQGGRTYYQSTLASLTSRLKSLNRCRISSSSVASTSFSNIGSSALYPLDEWALSEVISGRAWQNRALSDIACDKKEEWMTTRVQLLYADTLHRFIGPRRDYYFRQLHRRPPAQLRLYEVALNKHDRGEVVGTSFHLLAAYNTATIIYTIEFDAASHVPWTNSKTHRAKCQHTHESACFQAIWSALLPRICTYLKGTVEGRAWFAASEARWVDRFGDMMV
jgi:hypothetical protein